MKKRSIVNFIKFLSFTIIFILLFTVASSVLERKSYNTQWNYMGKLNEFYSLEKNSIEYIAVGASHAYCTVNPLEIWKDSGVKGFVLATQQQPLEASYYYIKEAFKTQSPKVVILEGIMAASAENDEGALYDAIDPLRASVNKFQMINAITEPKGREAFYFNIVKYHSRWKEITKNDILYTFKPEYDTYKGFVPLNSYYLSKNNVPDYKKIQAAEIPKENLQTLNKILELTKANNAELILMIAPYDVDKYGGIFKSERIWANEKNVEVIDFTLMLDELNIDPSKDYVDDAHLDISGAAKTSKYLSNYLKSFNLATQKEDEIWQKDYEKYISTAKF